MIQILDHFELFISVKDLSTHVKVTIEASLDGDFRVVRFLSSKNTLLVSLPIRCVCRPFTSPFLFFLRFQVSSFSLFSVA